MYSSLNMYFIDSDEYLRSYVFTYFYILHAVHHHAPGDDFFLLDIYLYNSTFAFCIYPHTLHFCVQALPVIINLKQILAFSSSTRCPLTRNIASFCRVLYLSCVMYSRTYMLYNISTAFAFSRHVDVRLSERKRMYSSTIPDSYRKMHYLRNLLFSTLFVRRAFRFFGHSHLYYRR